jgi:DNA gyrase subunit A
MGRTASGVRGIKLAPGDAVVGAVHPAEHDDRLLLVQAKGSAKRVAVHEFPVQGRGTKGVRCAVVSGRTGPVTAVCGTTDARDVTVRDADGAVHVLSVGAFPLSARDAAGGKIRNFVGVITGFEAV